MTIKSAYWDYGPWDGAKWDTLVCEITGAWTSDKDSWSGNIYVADTLTGAWTTDDDLWSGSIVSYITINSTEWEAPDIWDGTLAIRPPDTSSWIDDLDVWSSLIYITLFPPVYNAGGTWWFNVWGDRLPDWRARRHNLENAVESWRYAIKGAWTSEESTWGSRVELASIQEEKLQRQIDLMFGRFVPYDEEEDMLWLM